MDFRSEGMEKSLNLSSFLWHQVWKRSDVNHSGAGAVQKIDYTLVFLLRGTVNSKHKILQNGSKYHFLGKSTSKAKGQQFILFIIGKVTQCLFKLALIHAHIWRYTTADKADGLIQNIYHKIASVTLHNVALWFFNLWNICSYTDIILEWISVGPFFAYNYIPFPEIIESVYRSVSNPFIPDFPIITSADPLPFYVISFNGQGQI